MSQSATEVCEISELLAPVREKLAGSGGRRRLELNLPDYIPPLSLSAEARDLVSTAVNVLGECLPQDDSLIASAFYRDRLDPQECCVVLKLQQARQSHEEFWVNHSWLDRFTDIRDQLLACSVGMTLENSDRGLNVEFRLPVYRPKTSMMQHRNTIIYVEDDRFVRDATREVLETEGYIVQSFCKAEEAVSYIDTQAGRVNLVLTDLRLPGQDGRRLAATVHRLVPNVPVLITSGYGMVLEEDPLHHTYFLAKPYNAQILLAAVRRCLQVLHSPITVHSAAQTLPEGVATVFC